VKTRGVGRPPSITVRVAIMKPSETSGSSASTSSGPISGTNASTNTANMNVANSAANAIGCL